MLLRAMAAALLLGVSPLCAAEITAPSRIDGVIIYPGVAAITRIVEIDVPAGQHTIVVSGLPQALDPNSLRVEGVSTGQLQIGSIELRTQPIGGVTGPAGEVAQRLKALQEDRLRKQAEVQAISAKQAMIQSIGQQAPAILGGKDKPLDPVEWAKAWDAVGAGLRNAAEELAAANAALRVIDEEIGAISRQGGSGPRAGVTRAANISVDSPAGAKAALRLTYQVSGVTWRPSYDAALSTGSAQTKPKLVLVRRAVISQRTGEDWSDVTLAVSTAQARGGTAAPDVPPVRVAFNEPSAITQNAAPFRKATSPSLSAATEDAQLRRQEASDAARAAAIPAPVAQQQAQLEVAGFSAQFVMPGRVSISSDGSTRSVRLSSRESEPALGVKAAPGIDPRAYLEVRFTNEEEAPLLPGDVALTRDGVFVGQGRIGQAATGETVEMGFGVDDKVKVTRVPIRRREVEGNWIQGNRSDLREFKTVVKSLHDRPMRITVLDQMPFSENAAITVETIPNMTAPTEKNLQDRRGVLAWTYEYKPGEEKEIRHGFRIRWPGERELVLEPQPVLR
ncbi:MAG: mucoidy inhibitor MuiA family protein [Methylocystis sp.]|nr:mucoidy inhibitor MuiA family protein [Methylocystis sp.]MCA3582182.1 mucoidy inhibitor MuiA family protein [Methylocystis sp.]MCA3587926.1 mucoidy inhibitor MuiA family protein [Methylocystis sp.]MCA3590243.1 mucoidy inhibitor MuiA family protein [Methylocystis sp.]